MFRLTSAGSTSHMVVSWPTYLNRPEHVTADTMTDNEVTHRTSITQYLYRPCWRSPHSKSTKASQRVLRDLSTSASKQTTIRRVYQAPFLQQEMLILSTACMKQEISAARTDVAEVMMRLVRTGKETGPPNSRGT